MATKAPEQIVAEASFVTGDHVEVKVRAWARREETQRGKFLRDNLDIIHISVFVGENSYDGVDLGNITVYNEDGDVVGLPKVQKRLQALMFNSGKLIPAIRYVIKQLNPAFVLPSERNAEVQG